MRKQVDAIEKRGFDKGLMLGLTAGKEDGMRYTLMSIFARKLNGLSDDIKMKLFVAEIKGLDLLLLNFFEITSEEDIERLLMIAHTL